MSGVRNMKKVLLVLAVFAVVVFAAKSSQAEEYTYFPNGNIALYLDVYDLGGSDHGLINFNNDGTATAALLDWRGNVILDLYMNAGGFLYYSEDGINFYPL